jgi:hypothetical protein
MKSNAIVDDVNAKMRYGYVNLCEELNLLRVDAAWALLDAATKSYPIGRDGSLTMWLVATLVS